MKQLITWTPLPNGFGIATDGTNPVLKLSVRVSPRLTPDNGDAPLDNFADFVNWTGKPWSFTVQFGTEPNQITVTGLKPVNNLVPALWTKLFLAPPVTVQERKPGEYANRVVRSFPAARIHDYIKEQYTAVALAFPTELPTPGWLYGRKDSEARGPHPKQADFSPLDFREREGYRKQLDSLIKNRVIPRTYPSGFSATKATRLDFLQAELFHSFKGGKYDTPPKKPEFDFHRILAMLGDYPELLRALGFVFDLELAIPTGMGTITDHVVRIRPENPLTGGEDSVIALATRYDFDTVGNRFAAAPAGSFIVNGHLDLSGPDFSVAQVDIDGSAIKAINFTQTLGDLGIHKPAVLGTPTTAGVPALRSGGMSVLMADRASTLVTAITNGAGFETQLADPATRNNIVFSAVDVSRGYRIDIYDEAKGEWASLCRRNGDYTDPKGTFLLPQGLEDEGTVTVAPVSSSDPAGEKDLYLHEALFHWDGWSLVVGHPGKSIGKPLPGSPENLSHEPSDLANAIGLVTKFKVTPQSLPKLRFGRQYRLRARLVDIAGNSRAFAADLDDTGATTPLPYLRFEPVASPPLMSDPGLRPGESVDRLVIRSWADHAAIPTDETARRHVLPPRTSVQMAELHGMTDGPAPNGATSWYQELATRDKATITEFLPPGEIMDEAPYLPDPIAAGATIMGLPGADAPLAVTLPFTTGFTWPHAGTFRIILQEGIEGYEWREAERLLVIRLPKAGRAMLRLSCALPDAAMLDQLGIWQWISEATPPAWLQKFRKIAVEGRHWMLTPFRELTLIHAVQQPLAPPVLQGAAPVRKAGETFYHLQGLLHVHGMSTDKVDFRAAWNDLLPAPDAPEGFTTESRTADACRFNVSDPELMHTLMEERHELGDTKHRKISYWATATSRFREYFEDDTAPPPEPLVFTTPATMDRPADFVLNVPSSVRPLAPRVEYIIPTFGWDEERSDDTAFQRRSGNSLRVYLSGEWFSSGEGELLGAVLAHGPQIDVTNGLTPGESSALASPAVPPLPEKLKPLVTRWGIDPIWLSGLVHQTPTVHHFPDAVARGTDLTLEEHPDIPAVEPHWGVAVAGHAVAYDCQRKLWYCDITVEAGPSYYPFVRLALARYQPCSVPGTELSRVYTADCVQTAPDRLVSISADPGNPCGVRVSLSGVAPRWCRNVACPNRVIVRAEVCFPGADPPVWAPVAGPWVPLAEMQVSKTVTVWSGEIVLPQVRQAQRYRMVVEEYEFLNADPGRGLDSTAASELRRLTNVSKTAVWPRLVYSDTVEIMPE